MIEDPWAEPSTKAWVRHVIDNMVPKMARSAVVVSLVPDDRHGDVKFWVEIGASIMMDKPIMAVVFNDLPIPAKLALVADEIVRCPRGVNPASSNAIAEALGRMMDRLEKS